MPANIAKLDLMCEQLHPRLVVFDCLAASHNQRENDSAIRMMLSPLLALAGKHNFAGLIIHHLRKADVKLPRVAPTLDDMRGSTAIGGALVAVLALDRPDKSDLGNRRLSLVKSNFGLEREPVGFRWLSRPLATGGQESQFVFGPAPQPKAASRQGGDSQRRQQEAEAALVLCLGTAYEPSEDVIQRVQRRLPSLKSEHVKQAMAALRQRREAELQHITADASQPPVVHWRRVSAGGGRSASGPGPDTIPRPRQG